MNLWNKPLDNSNKETNQQTQYHSEVSSMLSIELIGEGPHYGIVIYIFDPYTAPDDTPFWIKESSPLRNNGCCYNWVLLD